MSEIRAFPAIPARTCLVIGGARSGKSAFAQTLAERAGRQPVYIATAIAWDEEMEARIARHRADRDGRWMLHEEPLALPEALRRVDSPDRVVLVDCLTLWLSNLMLGGHDLGASSHHLADLLPQLEASVILVSNEVGSGIVPDNALARAFRDAQGRLNQAMAAACDVVVLVAAGLPSLLKPGPDLDIRLGR